jgi:hypothetical protein
MPERVQGPAYYFPSIEKKYGRPISYGHATALVGHVLAQRAAEGTPQQPDHPSAGKDST